MSEVGTEGRAWVAEQLFGPDPCPRPTLRRPDPGDRAPVASPTMAIDLDAVAADPTNSPAAERDPNSGARRAAVGLACLFGVAVVAIVAVLAGGGGQAAAPTAEPPTAAVQPAPAAPSVTDASPREEAIGYTASATCPAGSTSAQALTDPRRGAAWTCVRGQQGARVDGQVLRVDLGGSHVLSAVSVTPGWVPRTPGAGDEWLRHRVVSRLQYVFDDADRTIFTQDTGDVHGPVTTALPRPVLASHVTVIVLQTARPPASPPGSISGVDTAPGFGFSPLGPFGATPPAVAPTSDPPPVAAADGDDAPVDATFSITALSFFGHPPR